MAVSTTIRHFIYERDDYACLKCQSKENLSIDHIRPKFFGGTDVWHNLQTLCQKCNSDKGCDDTDYRQWLENPVLPPEEKFDWGLPLSVIEKRYGVKKQPAKPDPVKQIQHIATEAETPFPLPAIKSTPSFIDFSNRKCKLFGYLNKDVGYGAQKGQPVYFDEREEKLILDFAGTKICYHYKSFIVFVDQCLPVPVKKSNDVLERYRAQEQCNFHIV